MRSCTPSVKSGAVFISTRTDQYSGYEQAALGGEMITNWLKLTSDMALLGLEAQRVIALRLLRIAAGGRGAHFERGRMVTEKIAAAQEAAATLMAGGSPGKVDPPYPPPVPKNRPRLSRHKK